MGDRKGYQWRDVPEYSYIDKLVDAKLQQMKILPSEVCTDAEFIRRVYLDLTGLPPDAQEVRAFLADAPLDARQARGAGGQAGWQSGVHRSLDEQMGRPVAGQSQIPRRTGSHGLPQLHPASHHQQQGIRQVRLRHPDGKRLEHGEPRRQLLQDPARSGRRDGEHDAAIPGRALQLQQVPRSSVRALDAGPILPDGRLLRAGQPQRRSQVQGPADRRHECRGPGAARRDHRRSEGRRSEANPHRPGGAADLPVSSQGPGPAHRQPPRAAGPLGHVEG